jgi:hypothetical protein
MRTNIVIDDKFMATGLQRKKDLVEHGLELPIKRKEQQAIRDSRGKRQWQEFLEEMRGGKNCTSASASISSLFTPSKNPVLSFDRDNTR